MQWQLNPYAGPLVISAGLSLVLAAIAWRRRPAAGAASMAALMAAMSLWAGAYALELLSTDLGILLFWVRVQYLAILSVPTLWLVFVLRYSGRSHWLTPRMLIILVIVPMVTAVLIWATDMPGPLYRTVSLEMAGPWAFLSMAYGPLFWAQAAYGYTVFTIATLLVLLTFLRGAGLQQVQSSVVLAGALVPLVGNALYVAGVSPLRYIDPTPILFVVTGLAAIWGVLRYRFLALLPVARATLIEEMNDGVAVIDAHGRVVDMNSAAQQLAGLPAAALLGAPASAVLPGWSDLATTLDPNHAWQTQTTLVVNGAETHWDVHVSPLRSDSPIFQGWLVVLRDVTARVRAEQSERQQRTVAEGLRDAIAAVTSNLSTDDVLDRILELTAVVVPNQHGNIMLIDGGWAYVKRARGYDSIGLGDWVSQLRFDVHETANLHKMFVTRQPLAIEDTAANPDWINFPQLHWLRSHAAAPIIGKGEVIGFLNLDSPQPGFFTQEDAQVLQAFAYQAGIAIENARLYTSLQDVNVKLRQALRAREEAIQNVSHELRTPLTLMLGYVEFIESGEVGPLTEEQREALRIITQQGHRLQFIFNSLLTLQTFAATDIQLHCVDLGPWLRAAVAAWSHRASDADVTLCLQEAPLLPPVMAAPNYLDLVLGNLLDNAIKFSSGGGQVDVSTWVSDNQVIVAVADQGIGIAHDDLPLVFGRFYQADSTSTRRYGGMGIGLALCKAIISAHGGRIWAESGGLSQGSTFFITLPVAGPTPPAVDLASAQDGASSSHASAATVSRSGP